MTAKGNKLWLLAAAALYALCFAVNLGGAWFEYGPATGWNLLVSLIYPIFWAAFTGCARRVPGRLRAAGVMAALTLLAGVFGLLARSTRAASLFMVPALLLAPLSAVPLYGLRCFLSWDLLYALCALMGGLWLLVFQRIRA